MIYAASFSKATPLAEKALGKPYLKIKIKLETSSSEHTSYFAEMFTEKQVFHKRLTEAELIGFVEQNAGITFKNCVVRTEEKEITYLANKKGKITKLERKLPPQGSAGLPGGLNKPVQGKITLGDKKAKNYLISEGQPVPFLIRLGIMTAEGKVISSKFDKFRQINRFLEFIDDILPEIESRPVHIADFGCGKSYLTFAVHYYLTEVKKIPCEIEGLDLKKDVIDYCNRLASELELKNLRFSTGDISEYSGEKAPDIVITLHACDTATDFALKYAVSKNTTAILSVPCCQHEVNRQLTENKSAADSAFDALLKWGIIREKFSSLVTDALRAEYLETQGYKVQMLEFIDMEHTPKNILIRAVKRRENDSHNQRLSEAAHFEIETLKKALEINPEILK